MVAGIRRNQLAALGFVRIFAIVKTLLQGLRDGFSLTDFVLFEIGRGRRQPSFCDRKFSNLFRTKQYDKILW